MPKNIKAHNLSKLLAYALGRRPDEFGLVPEAGGFFRIKEVLKAICEEDGYGYVRRGHLTEILLTIPDPGFEIVANRIRSSLPAPAAAEGDAPELPKLLFTCVRRRAYPHVLEKGITPAGHPQVVLSPSKTLAERIGRRRDADPVLLTVQVGIACDQGVRFQSAGPNLFLAAEIPPTCFRGPALPREKEKKTVEPAAPEKVGATTPGSFTIDIAALADPAASKHRQYGTKETGERFRNKKNKQRRERPPWRR